MYGHTESLLGFAAQTVCTLTVTVAIRCVHTHTVLTATAGITPTLAVGEQIHVAGKDSNGTHWAVRVLIQKSEADAQRGPKADKPKRSR